MKQDIGEEDALNYAMNFLFKNFSHASNSEKFPEITDVPESITVAAVLKPTVASFDPPEKIVHFKSGNFS